MARFYVDSSLVTGQQFALPENVLRHIQVLRLQQKEALTLFNGNGNEYPATLIELNRKKALVQIQGEILKASEQLPAIELLLCNIANDKMDLAIQKSVELGVSTISPIISERSQKLSQDKIDKRMEHWHKIIISSCEQCGNNTLPPLNLPRKIEDVANDSGLKLIMSPIVDNGIYTPLSTVTSDPVLVQLLVGPEGGFSSMEMKKAQELGFLPIQLGNLVLRSETAVIAGLTYVQLRYNNNF